MARHPEISVPDAIREVELFIERTEQFMASTPFLTMTMTSDEGEDMVAHPAKFTLGPWRRIRSSLYQVYGEEMFQHSRRMDEIPVLKEDPDGS